MDYLKYDSYLEKYRPIIGIRYNTMKAALNLFLQNGSPYIVEIGTLRNNGSFYGDGQSTLIFGEFCEKYGKHLITVDISPKAIECCKDATKEYADFIDYVTADSLDFLKDFQEWSKVGLIYFDGMDSDKEPTKAQEHELQEMNLSLCNAPEGTVFLLDDHSLNLGGKTLLATLQLEKGGYGRKCMNIIDDYQTLWLVA